MRAHLFDGLVGKLAGLVIVRGNGRDLVLRELARRIANHLVFFG
jgi:hypothetical protein